MREEQHDRAHDLGLLGPERVRQHQHEQLDGHEQRRHVLGACRGLDGGCDEEATRRRLVGDEEAIGRR